MGIEVLSLASPNMCFALLFNQLSVLKCAFYRTDKTVIGCSGFHGDCLTLTKIIEARLKVDASYMSDYWKLITC